VKTNIKSAGNRAVIAFLLVMISFVYGYTYQKLEEKPGTNINKEEEKKEHIPDTIDAIRLNRF